MLTHFNMKCLSLNVLIVDHFYYDTYRYIPESPRWLLVNDKVFEAKKVLINIGNVNRRPLPSEFTIKIPPKPPKSFILIALFRTRRMRLQMLVQMFEWYAECYLLILTT